MASLTKVKLNNIDSSVTFVYDPLILVNYGATLANTDIGFVFNRDGGVNSNVALYWNETTDRVTIAYTNATGLPNGNITINRFANVAADWYFGNLAGGTTNTVWVSANVLPTANAFYNFGSPTQRWNVGYFAATTLDLGGSQISVDPTNGFKFTVGGTGTPTYLASNGLIAGSSLTSAGTITAGGAINTSANVLASQVSAGSVVTTGVVNAGGNVLATTGIFNLLDVNGNVELGSVGTPGAGHTIIGNVTQTGAGTVFYNTPGNVMAAIGRFGQISSDGFINTSANISAAVGRFGSVSSDGFINTSGNVSAATHTGGNVVVSGVINTASNVLTSQITVFGNATIGAITTAGIVHDLVGNIRQSGAGTIFFNTPGNIMAAIGQFGSINSTGVFNTSGNVLATGGVFNALTVNGGITSTGFFNTSANISGAAILGSALTITSATGRVGIATDSGGSISIGRTDGTASSPYIDFNSSATAVDYDARILVTGNTGTIGGGQIQFTAASSVFSTVVNTRGNLLAAGLSVFGNATIGLAGAVSGQFHSIIGNVTQSSSGGAVYINTSGNVLAAQGSFGSINSTGFINTSGNVSAATGLFGAVTSTGFINTSGNVSAATVIAGTMTTTGTLTAAVVNSTGNILGATGILNSLTVGAVTSSGLINTSGNIIAAVIDAGSLESAGVIYANGTSAATSTSTGAIITTGGIAAAKDSYFAANVTIEGNLFINGNVSVFNTNNLSINDSLIYLADDNTADTLDIGFVSSFTNPGYQHTGFARDASDGIWKLFANVVPEPTTTVDFTNATYSNLLIGNLLARQITITGLNSAGFINTSGNVSAATVLAGEVTSTGFINTSGNVSASVGRFGSINSTGFINTSGNVSGATVLAGQISTTGNVLSNGLRVFGNSTIGLTGAVSGQFHSVIGNLTQSTSGGAVYINTSGNVMASQGSFGSINSTGFINTSGNVSASQVNAATMVATGNVTVGNLISLTGSGQFNGPYNENTTVQGVYVGNLNLTPRIGFFNGTAAQNWQIDNNFGTFRWYTPGTIRMQLDTNGNLTVNSYANISAGSVNGDSALQIYGNVSRGGVGYHDFMRVTSTFSGVTNPNKYFRLNQTGAIEIVNSAYNSVPFTLTDSGVLTVSGNITAGSLTTPGAQHTFFGNVQTNAIGFLQVPAGTTLQRPITGNVAGMIRFNLDTNSFEGYSNVWSAIGGGGAGGTPGGVSTTIQYNAGGAFGGIATMNYIVANGAIIISTGTTSTSASTGALQIIGGVGITENINTTGSISTSGLINTSANISASQVSAGSVVTTGVVNAGGNLLARTAILNFLDVNGNIAIGDVGTPGAGHSIIGNVTQSGAGTIYYNTPGNIMASQGFFGRIDTTGNIALTGTGLRFTADMSAATQKSRFAFQTSTLNNNTNIIGIPNGTSVQTTWQAFGNSDPDNSHRIFIGTTSADSTRIVSDATGTAIAQPMLLIVGSKECVRIGTIGNVSIPGNLTVNSDNNPIAIINGGANGVGNIGASGQGFDTVFAKATSAQYADLAETYASDRDYVPGTVLIFGGEREVTISTQSHDTAVAGVVSTNPAYHMNAAAEGVAVALTGRVPTKVKGPVKKGDRLVTSSTQGAAERLNMMHYQPGCIIGKALEDIADDSIQTIEVVVGRV